MATVHQYAIIQNDYVSGTSIAMNSPTRNVAVIGRERSLRFPGMTPSLLVEPRPIQLSSRSGAKPKPNYKGASDMRTIKNFLRDESGMETLEYAVIAGLIAAVAVAVYSSSGTWKTNLLNRLLNATTTS
jgi:Flp pilus assembly pilin Flp